ncbi:MAG: Pvc16 family protein [Fimbriimonas sp.]
MIEHVDEVIGSLLGDSVGKATGKPVEVSFGPPTSEASKTRRLNLYLHGVLENVALRAQGRELVRQPGDQGALVGQAPTLIELRYLLTAHAPSSSEEHAILAAALGLLLRNPVLTHAQIPSAVQDQVEEIRIVVAQPTDEAAPSLWVALGQPMRASLSVVVNVTWRFAESRLVRLVREILIGVGQGLDQDGANRNIALRSLRVSVAGIVTDADTGAPLAGAKVEVDGVTKSTLTDARGFFSVENLSPGVKKVLVSAPGYDPAESTSQVPPPGRSDLLVPLGIGLSRPKKVGGSSPVSEAGSRKVLVQVSGQIKRADGSPAAFTQVRIGTHEAISDGEGNYLISGLEPGENKLEVLLPGKGWTESGKSGKTP